MTKKLSLIGYLVLVALAFPLLTSAAALSSQGVFGCSQAGSLSMSVGTLGAIGGTYVPVNDASVTLNTGYLVYKACVLDGIAVKMRENATANIVKDTVEELLTGRTTTDENGNTIRSPLYPVDLAADQLQRANGVVAADLNGSRLNMLNPIFQNDVKTAVYRNYSLETQNPGSAVACSYTGSPDQLYAIQHGQGTGGAYDVLALTDPNCNPFWAYVGAKNLVLSDAAANENNVMTQLGWGNGFYPVLDEDGNVVTPGFLVAETAQQQLGSGFRQQESASEINQMIGSMFANIGNQIISAGVGGLRGLVNNALNRPSYLSQIVDSSTAGLRDSAANAGLQILSAAREVESGYLDAENQTASVFIQQIGRLRGAEDQCWELIIPRVKTYASAGDCSSNSSGVQTCNGSFTIRIATSTVFSQRVIDSQIAPLASTTADNIKASDNALSAIDQLIANVSNSNSQEAQATALQQLDVLVSQKVLHTQYDQKAAEEQLQSVQDSIGNNVTETIRAWGDSTDTNVGWCNVNNSELIRAWANRWKV